jgi:hypothetical protein
MRKMAASRVALTATLGAALAAACSIPQWTKAILAPRQ